MTTKELEESLEVDLLPSLQVYRVVNGTDNGVDVAGLNFGSKHRTEQSNCILGCIKKLK